MAYKMKGPSLYKDKLTVNRNGYDNKPDGRSKSSMAQKEVHSMFYQNKPGAPDMKTGKYEHSFEKGGAPKKEDKAFNKQLGDIKNRKARKEEGKKRDTSHKEFVKKNPGMFKKDKEGILRDKEGRSVREANVAEQRRSLQRMDKEGAKAMKRGRKAAEESQKPGAPKKGETEAEFLARMKKQGMTVKPEVNVKKSEKLTKRDKMAKKIHQASLTPQGIKKGMEQSAKSSSYKKADEVLAKKGDTEAKRRLRKRAAQTKKVKKVYEKNPGMTQKEVDKMMSER